MTTGLDTVFKVWRRRWGLLPILLASSHKDCMLCITLNQITPRLTLSVYEEAGQLKGKTETLSCHY